jgi:hypothetical protein
MNPYPSLYQINTRVWLTELSRALRRPATLDDIPDAELDRVAEMGFDWIWLLSVWQTVQRASESREATRNGVMSSRKPSRTCARRIFLARGSRSPGTRSTEISEGMLRWPVSASDSESEICD